MKRFIIAGITLLCLLLPAAPVFAYNPLGGACGTSGDAAAGSSVCGASSSDPIAGPNGVLEKVTLLIASIAGIVAIIIIVISGFMYVTSAGDAQKAASARTAIIGSLVGLVIIAAATSIITFVVSKLV